MKITVNSETIRRICKQTRERRLLKVFVAILSIVVFSTTSLVISPYAITMEQSALPSGQDGVEQIVESEEIAVLNEEKQKDETEEVTIQQDTEQIEESKEAELEESKEAELEESKEAELEEQKEAENEEVKEAENEEVKEPENEEVKEPENEEVKEPENEEVKEPENEETLEAEDKKDIEPIQLEEHIQNLVLERKIGQKWVEVEDLTVQNLEGLRVTLQYSIPAGVLDKDTGKNKMTYSIPAVLKGYKGVVGRPILSEDGKKVGTYKIEDNGKVTFEFNDDIDYNKTFDGSFTFQATIEVDEDDEDVEIQFWDKQEGSVTVTPKPVQIEIDKEEFQLDDYEDDQYELLLKHIQKHTENTHLERWYELGITTPTGTREHTIDVEDTFIVDDNNDWNCMYDKNSFFVQKVLADGSLAEPIEQERLEGLLTIKKSDKGNSFVIKGLPSLEKNEKYYIYYKADLLEENTSGSNNHNGGGNITNKVKVTTDDTSDIDQLTIKKKSLVAKNGEYDKKNQRIKYIVTVNSEKNNIGGYKFEDSCFCNGEEVELTISEMRKNGVLVRNPKAEYEKILKYGFPKGDTSTYQFVYYIDNTDGSYNGQTINNKATITTDNGTKQEASSSVNVPEAGRPEYDYSIEKKSLTDKASRTQGIYKWGIKFSIPYILESDKATTLTLTDDIHTTQPYEFWKNVHCIASENNLKLIKSNGEDITKEIIKDKLLTWERPSDTKGLYSGFKLQLSNKFLQKYAGEEFLLTYESKIDKKWFKANTTYKLINKVTYGKEEAKAIETYYKGQKLKKESKVEGNEQEYQENHKDCQYQVGSKDEIYYQITIDPNAYEELPTQLVDQLPDGVKIKRKADGTPNVSCYLQNQDGYQFSETAVNHYIKSASLEGNKLTISLDVNAIKKYLESEVGSSESKGKVLAFRYSVTVPTPDQWNDKENGKGTFTNTVTDGQGNTKTNTVIFKTYHHLLDKSCEQVKLPNSDVYQNTIHSEVIINKLGLTLGNSDKITLTDKFYIPHDTGITAQLDYKSFKLFEYDENAAGNRGKEVSIDKYRIETEQMKVVGGKKCYSFRVTVENGKAYVLVYDYNYNLNGYSKSVDFTNTIELSGQISTSDKVQIIVQESSAVVMQSELTIYKCDAENSKIALAGAEFKIDKFDKKSKKWIIQEFGNLKSNQDGEIVIPLKMSTNGHGYAFDKDTLYRLIETKAPQDYLLDTTPTYFVWGDKSKVVKPESVDNNSIRELQKKDRIEVTNDKIPYQLPETGGCGTTPFYILGILWMFGGMVVYLINRKHRNRKAQSNMNQWKEKVTQITKFVAKDKVSSVIKSVNKENVTNIVKMVNKENVTNIVKMVNRENVAKVVEQITRERVKKFAVCSMVGMIVFSNVAPIYVHAEETVKHNITINEDDEKRSYAAYQVVTGKYSKLDGVDVLVDAEWGSHIKGKEAAFLDKFGEAADLSAYEFIKKYANQDPIGMSLKMEKFFKNASGPIEAVYDNAAKKHVFKNLPAGYYFIKETTDPDYLGDNQTASGFMLQLAASQNIEPKALKVPTVEKKVEEDSEIPDNLEDKDKYGDNYNDVADWDIGQVKNFRIYGTIPDNFGLERYEEYKLVFHDTYDQGITPLDINKAENLKIVYKAENGKETVVTPEFKLSQQNGKLTFTLEKMKALFAKYKLQDNGTFIIEYKAKLNEKAKRNLAGNENAVYLEYTNNPGFEQGGKPQTGRTPEDKVIVFTYDLSGTKIDGDATDKKLAGAEFIVGRTVKEGNDTVEQWAIIENGFFKEWTTDKEKAGVIVSNDAGKFMIKGLDQGEYSLEEVKAPEGYNLLLNPVKVFITPKGTGTNSVIYRQTYKGERVIQDLYLTQDNAPNFKTKCIIKNEIVIENLKGITLPETGDIGTPIFYIIGMLLATSGGVFLVARKKMNK